MVEEQVQNWLMLFTILIEYSAFVLGTGAFLLRRRLKGRGFSYGILVSTVIGNIICINLVFLAFFLQLDSRIGILFLWLLLIINSWFWPIKKTLPEKIKHMAETVRNVLYGEHGIKLLRKKIFDIIKKKCGYYIKLVLKQYLIPHFFEIIFFIGVILFALWYYSYQAMQMGGIGAPDVNVHTEWIQRMCDGNIFGDGIYPFGFHCIVYLIKQVFGHNLLNLIVYFAFAQDFFIFLFFYLLARRACHFHGTAMLSFIGFVMLDCFLYNYRYQFALPQEYGMLGLYPAIIFLFLYFEERKKEIKAQKLKAEIEDSKEAKKFVKQRNREFYLTKDASSEYLWLFGFSVALTFMAHFYITIICFFLCAALVLFYLVTFLKRKCFMPIICVVFICFGTALLPMILWFIGGKPLQASLNWAVSVMNEPADEKKEESNTPENKNVENEKIEESLSDKKEIGKDNDRKESKKELIEQKLGSIYKELYNNLKFFVKDKGLKLSLLAVIFTLIFDLLAILILKDKSYAKLQVAICIYFVLLLLLAVPDIIHFPRLMETERVAIFISYVGTLILVFPLDIITSLFYRIKGIRYLVAGGIYLLCGYAALQIYNRDLLQPMPSYYILQYKEAMQITKKILNEYEDFTWTIVSPVDELPYIRKNGYHYEWIELLSDLALYGDKKEHLYIPTKYIFFYIEKRPITYSEPVYIDKGIPNYKKISKEDADYIFNTEKSTSSFLYQSHRNIIESKAYYWAKKYASYFPREMTLYYETDKFICYQLVQDEYSLNNLLIDYEYNIGTKSGEEEFYE